MWTSCSSIRNSKPALKIRAESCSLELLSQLSLVCRLSDLLGRDSRDCHDRGTILSPQTLTVFCRHSNDGMSTVEKSRLSRHCRRQSVDNSSIVHTEGSAQPLPRLSSGFSELSPEPWAEPVWNAPFWSEAQIFELHKFLESYPWTVQTALHFPVEQPHVTILEGNDRYKQGFILNICCLSTQGEL